MRRLKSPKLYAAFLALFILGSLYLLFGPKNLLIHHVIQTWEYQADNPSYQEPVQVEIYGVYYRRLFGPSEYYGVFKIDKYPETLPDSARATFSQRHANLLYSDFVFGTLLCSPNFEEFALILPPDRPYGTPLDSYSWSTGSALFITSAQGGRQEALELIRRLSRDDDLFGSLSFR